MINKKENIEIQNSRSPELPDDELEAVAGGAAPDIDMMMGPIGYITVKGHALQKNCRKCGNDCWTYYGLWPIPSLDIRYEWHCTVCEASGITNRLETLALTELPASSYPLVKLRVPEKGG